MSVTLPTAPSTANLDSSADDPKLARADLLAALQAIGTLLGQINALGITQVGDGIEIEAQAAGTKDKVRIKLDGAGTASGLARSAAGLKIAAQGIKPSMLEGIGSDTPGNSLYFGTNSSGQRGAWALPVGILLQRRYSSNNTPTTITTPAQQSLGATAAPTTSQGTQFLSDTITLANAANKVVLRGQAIFTTTANRDVVVTAFRGSTCIATWWQVASGSGQVSYEIEDAPGSTGPHTYSLRIGDTLGSTLYLNSSGAAAIYGSAPRSTMTLEEFA